MSNQEQPRVLIVEDEVNIRDAIAFTLKREGFAVSLAGSGPEGLDRAAESPDVIVLDIMLPGLDGLEVLRRVRQTSNVPVLLLSAKGDEIDRVVGLEIGADDYITKPFAMRELVARIRSILRRVQMNPRGPEHVAHAVSESANGETIVAGNLRIDLARRSARAGGRELDLKPKEFDLLAYFARHPGVVMSRDALLREVWGYEYRIDTRTVDVHIRWLRKKLEDNPASPRRLITVRGSGYRFVPDTESDSNG